jgi:hypothetical protein
MRPDQVGGITPRIKNTRIQADGKKSLQVFAGRGDRRPVTTTNRFQSSAEYLCPGCGASVSYRTDGSPPVGWPPIRRES